MTFKAPWERALLITTVAVSLFLLGVGVAVFFAVHLGSKGEADWVAWLVLLMQPAIMLGAYVSAPTAYRITGREIVIQRPIGAIRIPFTEIQEIRRLGKEEIGGSIRTWGSDGFFGYYGRYRNSRLGSFRMYATDRSRLVLIRGKKTYVISPDKPDTFVEMARGYIA